MQPNWFPAENDVLLMLFIHLVSSRLCLHLDFHMKIYSNVNRAQGIKSDLYFHWRKSLNSIVWSLLQQSLYELQWEFCQEQDGEAGPVVSNQVSSLCLCLAECYTGWHSCVAFNNLQFNRFLSLRTGRYTRCGAIAFYEGGKFNLQHIHNIQVCRKHIDQNSFLYLHLIGRENATFLSINLCCLTKTK